jgi:hypothetical protein
MVAGGESFDKRRFVCVVHRLNTEKENSDLPIGVNCVGYKRKYFNSGEEVVLYGYHINILRDAVEETELELPAESAIYEDSNPVAKAEINWPGFKARVREEDGAIMLYKRTPMYSVEVKRAINEGANRTKSPPKKE